MRPRCSTLTGGFDFSGWGAATSWPPFKQAEMSNSEPSAIVFQGNRCMCQLFLEQSLEFFEKVPPAGLRVGELVVPGCFGAEAGLNQTKAGDSSSQRFDVVIDTHFLHNAGVHLAFVAVDKGTFTGSAEMLTGLPGGDGGSTFHPRAPGEVIFSADPRIDSGFGGEPFRNLFGIGDGPEDFFGGRFYIDDGLVGSAHIFTPDSRIRWRILPA